MRILIIGAGIAGCSIARLLCENNEITIFEKNNHIGGNCYDFYNSDNILVHKYGPHIFHTSNHQVWSFVNKFAKFNTFIHKVLVSVGNDLIEMPINLNSIKHLFPDYFDDFLYEVNKLNLYDKQVSIAKLINSFSNKNNIEIVNYIYQNVFENYSTKMWGKPINQLDPKILERVKISLNYEWNYFPNDNYCGLPVNGYTEMFKAMINHPNIKLFLNKKNTEYHLLDNLLLVDNENYDFVIYTGSLDELFNYCYGQLPYRSLYILFETAYVNFFQPSSIVNFPNHPQLTRICEYKQLTGQQVDNKTTISREYPGDYNESNPKFNIRFYPINNEQNNDLYKNYYELTKKINNLFLLGRLAEYKYYDMDEIIENAINLAHKINN